MGGTSVGNCIIPVPGLGTSLDVSLAGNGCGGRLLRTLGVGFENGRRGRHLDMTLSSGIVSSCLIVSNTLGEGGN